MVLGFLLGCTLRTAGLVPQLLGQVVSSTPCGTGTGLKQAVSLAQGPEARDLRQELTARAGVGVAAQDLARVSLDCH